MKKIYIQPDIEEIDIETDSLLQVVSGETGSGNVWGDDDGTGEVLAKEHNSIWEEWEE